jgi:hypothetical protein
MHVERFLLKASLQNHPGSRLDACCLASSCADSHHKVVPMRHRAVFEKAIVVVGRIRENTSTVVAIVL